MPAVRSRASETPPRGREEVVEQRVARAADVERRAGAVDHPADVVGRCRRSASPGGRPRVSGAASRPRRRRRWRRRSDACSARRTAADGRRHAVADPVPGARRPRAGTRRRSSSARRAHSSLTRNRRPSIAGRQSPPAARDPGDVLGDAARAARRACVPQSAMSGMAASCSSSACVAGSSPVRETACTRRSSRAPGAGEREDDVDHGQPGADEEHVAGPAASRRTTSRAPGAHGSATKKAERRSASGAQACPAAGRPVARTTASPMSSWPSCSWTVAPAGGAADADRASAEVAQARRSRRPCRRRRRGSRRGSDRTGDAARRCRARASDRRPAGGPARRRSAPGPRGSALMPAAGTLRRCSSSVVPNAVPRPPVGGVDEHDVDARAALAGGAGEVDGDQGAGGSATDHDDLRDASVDSVIAIPP